MSFEASVPYTGLESLFCGRVQARLRVCDCFNSGEIVEIVEIVTAQ